MVTVLTGACHEVTVKVSAHTLRHTFALNYLRQNPGKLVDLSSLLGHGRLDLTAFIREPAEKSCRLI